MNETRQSEGMTAQLIVAASIAALIGVATMSAGCDAGQKAKEEADANTLRARLAAQAATDARAACERELPSRKAEYTQAMAQRQWAYAAASLGACPQVLDSPELRRLQSEARGLDLAAEAANPKLSAAARVAALDRLSASYPELYRGKERLHAQLRERETREAARERRRQGVSIGMTADEVLQSSWGRPQRVNRNTYSWGVTEQWVYPGGYLYFRDGTLESVSTRE